MKKLDKGGTNPATMFLMKLGQKVLPEASGSAELARSAVSPSSLMLLAITRSVAARFFSETVDVLRAGSNQEDERTAFALSVASSCGLGGEFLWI